MPRHYAGAWMPLPMPGCDHDRYRDRPANEPLRDGFVREAGAFEPVGDPFRETRQEAHLEPRQK